MKFEIIKLTGYITRSLENSILLNNRVEDNKIESRFSSCVK